MLNVFVLSAVKLKKENENENEKQILRDNF